MSVAELRAAQEALHVLSGQTRAMRREQLVQCLPQSDEILSSAQRCHAALDREYQNEYNTYTDNFSCCARLFSTKRAVAYFDTHVKQKKEIAHEAGSIATSAHKVNVSIRNAKFEKRKNWNGGVACVYNPITGQVEWKEKWHHGVAGCWNPVAQRSEWKTNWNGGVAGVFNHATGCVEWKEKWHHGVGGCWNPNLQCVEWKDKWNHGVCGVWNPLMGCVEWKTNWNGGVAGYFDSAAGRVVWVESWHDGIAIVVYDAATNTFMCSSGDCWDWSK